jgi:hypothetical protein
VKSLAVEERQMHRRALHRLEISLALGALLVVATIFIVMLTKSQMEIATNVSNLADTFFNLAKLAVGILIVLLVPLLLYRFGELVLRPPELVVSAFINASGKDDLAHVADGLAAQMREMVIKQGLDARHRFRERGTMILPHGYLTPDDWPLPKQAADYGVATLEAGLRGTLTPSIAPVAQLLSILLPTRGHNISCVMQVGMQAEHTPAEKVGLTVEITDLKGSDRPSIRTFWLSEHDRVRAMGNNRAPESTSSSQSGLSLAGLYSSLVTPAATWVAIEFFRRHVDEWVRRHSLPWNKKKHLARMRYYVGEQFEAAALTTRYSSIGREFLDLAIYNFKRSRSLDPTWFLPLERLAVCNLAICRSYDFVQRIVERPSGQATYDDEMGAIAEATEAQEAAISAYKAAFHLGRSHDASREELARIEIGLASAQLVGKLAGLEPRNSDHRTSNSLTQFPMLERDPETFFENPKKQNPANKRTIRGRAKIETKHYMGQRQLAERRKDVAFVLFSLARWHALASMVPDGDSRLHRAKCISALTYSLVLDWDRWSPYIRSGHVRSERDFLPLRNEANRVRDLVKQHLDDANGQGRSAELSTREALHMGQEVIGEVLQGPAPQQGVKTPPEYPL